MQSVRNDLVRLSVLSALVITFALAWGSPFTSAPSAQAQDQAQQPAPDVSQKQSITFTGTITHSGAQYVLRDTSGVTYALDDGERAKPFEGKTVKVTGQLDQTAKLIHVETIEEIAA